MWKIIANTLPKAELESCLDADERADRAKQMIVRRDKQKQSSLDSKTNSNQSIYKQRGRITTLHQTLH